MFFGRVSLSPVLLFDTLMPVVLLAVFRSFCWVKPPPWFTPVLLEARITLGTV
jgi:hypothetical protein